MNGKQIMAIYDAEICKGGSADSVIQRTVLAAIAAHDAKRKKVLMWREGPHRFYMECKENLNDGVGEYTWAYIEREENNG